MTKYKGNKIDIGKCETFDVEVTIRIAAKYLKDETLLAKIGRYVFRNEPDFASVESKYHMYVNKDIQAKRETQKTQKNQTCLQRKKQSLLH